jgi:hypothetical protein
MSPLLPTGDLIFLSILGFVGGREFLNQVLYFVQSPLGRPIQLREALEDPVATNQECVTRCRTVCPVFERHVEAGLLREDEDPSEVCAYTQVVAQRLTS